MALKRGQIECSRRRGIATLEFVMILPVLLILLFGVLEYGWMLTKSGQLVNAAREGARVGARAGATNGDITSMVSTRMSQSGLGGYSISITPGVNAGDVVTVSLTLPYSGNADLTGLAFLPRPANLHASVSMSKEGP